MYFALTSLTPSIVTGSLAVTDDDEDDEDDDDDEDGEVEMEEDSEDGEELEEVSTRVLISKMIHLHFRLAFTVPMFFAFAKS